MANLTFMDDLNVLVLQAEYIDSLERQLSSALDALSGMTNNLLNSNSSVRILRAINENAVSQISHRKEGLLQTRAGLNLDERCRNAKLLADDVIKYRSVMEAVTAELLKEEST